MTAADASPIEIFRTGTHTATSGRQLAFSDADLAAIAAAYDPARHEAPLVVGHPETDAPAYGWVTALAATDGRLQASVSQLDPAFAELVREGRFKKISAAFYAPDAAANPTPGTWHLKHVGFLGAAPPAVKGLPDHRRGPARRCGWRGRWRWAFRGSSAPRRRRNTTASPSW